MFQPDPFDGRSLEELTVWAETQFQKLANIHAEFETESVRFTVFNAEPAHPRQGHTYYADGTNWDPGNGEGPYTYDGSNWVSLAPQNGTWTPVLAFGGASTGITYNARAAEYAKFGDIVHASGYIFLANKGSATGVATISLPFTVKNALGAYAAASLRLSNISFADHPQGLVNINTADLELNQITNAGTNSNIDDTNFANNSSIIFQITYIAA